jgi:hypothetical protein
MGRDAGQPRSPRKLEAGQIGGERERRLFVERGAHLSVTQAGAAFAPLRSGENAGISALGHPLPTADVHL